MEWLLNPANWTGDSGIFALLGQHLAYSFGAIAIALLIGVPIGLHVGRTGHGTFAIVGIANALRALPTLGLLILLVVIIAPVFASDLAFVVPGIIVLVLLAVPPIMTSTYAGIASVDRSVVDAARGMGMTPRAILFTVQVPCALPLIISGLRAAILQVVSTATIAAYVSLGGLGRLIIDGQAQNDYGQMLAGAILVAVMAVMLDLIFSLLARYAVSPGVSRRVVASLPVPDSVARTSA